MLPKSMVDLYAAMRRDTKAGLSIRALQRKYDVGFLTVQKADVGLAGAAAEASATAAIDQACRMLRLPTIRSQFPELAETADREQMSYLGFLSELLLAECDDRARRRSERRIKAAGLPRDKSLRKFVFDANPNIDPAIATSSPNANGSRRACRSASSATPARASLTC